MTDTLRNDKGQFVMGHIGVGGRPKGSRNKLQEDFITDVYNAWQTSGNTAIADMIEKNPGDFVKMVAGLLPKEATLNVNTNSELTDDELAERIRALAAQLRPFLAERDGELAGGTEGTERQAIASRVH